MKDARVVVLSSWRSPILGTILQHLAAEGIAIHSIVFDGEKSPRSLAIHEERTQGHFQEKTIFDLEQLHLPCYFMRDHQDENCLALLAKIQPDLLVNGGVRQILRTPLLHAASIGVVNGHPGLLPKYRGCTCLEWAVYNNDPVGATCHFMDTGIDSGPVIFSQPMPVSPGEPYERIRSRIIDHSAHVLARGIRRIFQEGLRPELLLSIGEKSYYNVMPEDKLQQVKEKLRSGAYHCTDKKTCGYAKQ